MAAAVTGSAMAIATAALAPSIALADSPIVPQTPALATITGTASNPAPWNEWQGDQGTGLQLGTLGVVNPAQVLPTYEPAPGSTDLPNLSVFDGSDPTDSATSTPYESGTVGTPGPLAGYCGSGDFSAESGASGAVTPSTQPAGETLPLGPYYFPHIVLNADGRLTGYFDYRPKDENEAVVAATSTDGGKGWSFDDRALEQSAGYCAAGDVNDDGQGHPNVLNLGGATSAGDVTSGGTNDLYTLQRPPVTTPGSGCSCTASPERARASPWQACPPANRSGSIPTASTQTAPR